MLADSFLFIKQQKRTQNRIVSLPPGTGWQREGDVRTSGQPLQETLKFRVRETSKSHGQGTREFVGHETSERSGQVHAGVSPGLASISNFFPCPTPPPLFALRISLFRL